MIFSRHFKSTQSFSGRSEARYPGCGGEGLSGGLQTLPPPLFSQSDTLEILNSLIGTKCVEWDRK